MAKTSFNQQKAYELYHAHKTDAEISVALGVRTTTITTWRRNRKLKNVSPNAKPRDGHTGKRINLSCGVHYRKVLNQSQAKVMSRFLTALSYAGRECAKAGIKPDVGMAISAWSGKEVKSYAERTTSVRYQQGEKRANGK